MIEAKKDIQKNLEKAIDKLVVNVYNNRRCKKWERLSGCSAVR